MREASVLQGGAHKASNINDCSLLIIAFYDDYCSGVYKIIMYEAVLCFLLHACLSARNTTDNRAVRISSHSCAGHKKTPL